MDRRIQAIFVLACLVAACTGDIRDEDTSWSPATAVGDGDGDGDSDDGDGDGDSDDHGAGDDGSGDGDDDGDSHGDGDSGDGDATIGDGDGDGASDAGTEQPPDDPPDMTDPCESGGEALAPGLRIREISFYQVVKVPLVQDGSWLSNHATPIVQGKKALVRVFVDTLTGFSSHTVRGVLTLENGGQTRQLTAELSPSGASSDGARSSTFNFMLEPADIGPDTQLSVSIVESSCPSTLGEPGDARFPVSGRQPLGAKKVGKLRVVVVPMVVNGRSPDTGPAQLAAMREAMLAHYPVPDVEITTRAPVQSQYSVGANGQGWSGVLDEVLNARYQDRADDDLYYYGVMSPASSFQSYCGGGCVLGLAPLVGGRDPDQQGGLGVGFANDYTPSTMVHELGHAHGRQHAPCVQGGQIDGVDDRYPYDGGDTGVWGWDSRDDRLLEPDTKDVMGYCEPAWMSDYTYNGIASRSASVNTSARILVPEGAPTWQSMLLFADGRARWRNVTTRRMPAGDVEVAQVLGADGQIIDTVHVVRVRMDHLDDAFLYLPTPQAGWRALVLSDRTITLPQVAKAR